MLGKEMADITKTVGSGKQYATLTLWDAGEGGVDPGAGFTSIAECSGYLGSGANINGAFVRGAIIRGDVTWDGTNDSALSSAEQLTIAAGTGINVEDLRIFTNNQFVSALNYNADFILMDRVVLDNTTAGINAIDINGAFTNGHIRNFVARGGLDTVMAGFNQGTNLTNGLVYWATDKGVEGSSSASMIITDVFAFNNGGQDIDSAGGFTLNDVATEDLTGTYTGYGSAELVNFATGDLRTKSTSFLATAGSPFIGALLEASSGISLTVTEVLNSFTDTSNINIDYNVSAIITETLNSFGDTSVISVTSGQVVNLTVTETLSAFTDVSNINVSANIELLVTEVLNSFLDGANVTIAKDITLQVTEVLNSFADNSSLRLPANWVDKIKVTTTYTTQAPVSTTWIDKG
jgi:hypothetical protein